LLPPRPAAQDRVVPELGRWVDRSTSVTWLLTPAVAAAWFDIGRRAALMLQRHQSR
jgi:hypothetical protein